MTDKLIHISTTLFNLFVGFVTTTLAFKPEAIDAENWMKLGIGVPGAIYMILKISSEFIIPFFKWVMASYYKMIRK